MRRVAIIASASGNGKTTLGRELAARLDVPCHPLVRLRSTEAVQSWLGGVRR